MATKRHKRHKDLFDPRYFDFFACFNAQKYFEAHEVLEELWHETPRCSSRRLGDTDAAGDSRYYTNWQFYKGLIQVPAVFVHLQKGNLGGAAALLRRAKENLGPFAGDVGRAPSRGESVRPVNPIPPTEGGRPTIQNFHEGLDVAALLAQLDAWREAVARGENPYRPNRPPRLAPKGLEV